MLGLALKLKVALGDLQDRFDSGAPHDHYFSSLNSTLKQQGGGEPRLLIDLGRLDANLACVQRHIDRENIRLVVKSLPSEPLLRYISDQLHCQRFMVFHRPFLNTIAEQFAQADILLGKPMLIEAVDAFYQSLPDASGFNPEKQLQWLVDTPERLQEYLNYARSSNRLLRINIEIDVGMHRGGVTEPGGLRQMLDLIADHPGQLMFAGLMGYDAHVVKAPPILASTEAALQQSNKRYAEFVAVLSGVEKKAAIFNGAGSPTYQLHGSGASALKGVVSPINDISLGSCLLQPTDFDLPSLADHQPAVFIAAPVLKKLPGLRIPFLEKISNFIARFLPNWGETLFLYGGNWMAEPVSPGSMKPNQIYGLSSNQQLMTVSERANITPGDYVFFRPVQSEAVLLQLGELWAVRDGEIEEQWPTLQQVPQC